MKLVLAILMLFIVGGCSSKNMSVATVTHEFWAAQQQNDINKAKTLTVDEDSKKTKLYEKIKIKTATFEDVQRDGDKAVVPTKLYLKGDKDIKEVEFDTILNNTKKGWRVNMTSTKKALYIALAKQVMGNMSSVLKDGLGEVGNIKKIFGDFIKNFKGVVEKGAN